MKTLSPKIVDELNKKLGLAKSSIGPTITRRKHLNAKLTPNAVAFMYAIKKGVNILRFLDDEDKNTLPPLDIVPAEKITIRKSAPKTQKKQEIIVSFESSDPFVKGHIAEINRAYNSHCYTSVFILSRKIIENLIVDILMDKFPPMSLSNKELYYDTTKRRVRDFGEILENLYKKRADFGQQKAIAERLYRRALLLKDDANNKTHSWYHLVTSRQEVKELDVQMTIELIKKLL